MSNIQLEIVERGNIDTPNIYIHEYSLSWLSTGTSIDKGPNLLSLWNDVAMCYPSNICTKLHSGEFDVQFNFRIVIIQSSVQRVVKHFYHFPWDPLVCKNHTFKQDRFGLYRFHYIQSNLPMWWPLSRSHLY